MELQSIAVFFYLFILFITSKNEFFVKKVFLYSFLSKKLLVSLQGIKYYVDWCIIYFGFPKAVNSL